MRKLLGIFILLAIAVGIVLAILAAWIPALSIVSTNINQILTVEFALLIAWATTFLPPPTPGLPPPSGGWSIRRVKWILHNWVLPCGIILVLLGIVIVSLLMPVSLSALAIAIPLGMITCIIWLIRFFIHMLSGRLIQPASPPSPSRRFFLYSYLFSTVGAATASGYLITRLQALLALFFSPTIVTVVYSTEKEAWLRKATDTFNQQVASKGIQVVLVDERGSLEAAKKIVAGTSKPTVWCPASTLELHYLSTQWQSLYPGQDIINYAGILKPPSLVHSPLVFAIWQSRATALSKAGYKLLDWSDLHDLLSKKKTWSAIGGNAEWGAIKFGQTQPDLSNSGLLTLALLSYTYFGKPSGLTVGDIKNTAENGFQEYFRGIENSVWCFGPSSGPFIDTVIQRGPPEFDIITTYENLVLTKEAEATQQHEPLNMYYPPTLNMLSDHPFAILQGNWVTPEQADAARQFRDFLLDEKQQQSALTYGFRSSFSSHFTTSTPFSDSPNAKRIPITDPIADSRFLGQPPMLQNQIKAEEALGPFPQTLNGDVVNALIELWQTPNFGYTTRQC